QRIDPARVCGRVHRPDRRPVPPEPGEDGVAAADAVSVDGPKPFEVAAFLARTLPLVLKFASRAEVNGHPLVFPRFLVRGGLPRLVAGLLGESARTAPTDLVRAGRETRASV